MLNLGRYVNFNVKGQEMRGGYQYLDNVAAGENALEGGDLGGNREDQVVDEQVRDVADDFDNISAGEQGAELL